MNRTQILEQSLAVQRQIDALLVRQADLLGQLNGAPSSVSRSSGSTRRQRAPRDGESALGSGLAPAVVKVIRDSGKASLSVSEILDGLNNNNYVFESKNPKRALAARIYVLKGVAKVGAGQFGIDPNFQQEHAPTIPVDPAVAPAAAEAAPAAPAGFDESKPPTSQPASVKGKKDGGKKPAQAASESKEQAPAQS